MATKVYVDPEEVKLMEEAADYLRDKLLVRLVFRSGCRISEALGISVTDIDFNQGLVTIEHLKTRMRLSCPQCGGRLSRTAKFCSSCGVKVEGVVAEENKARRLRTLPVDTDTLNILRDFIDVGGPIPHNGKRLLFGITRGRAWHIVAELADKAGLEGLVNPETGRVHHVSPHKLRDAFAIHAVKVDDSGDGLRLLQEHLGHKSISTTMKYRKIAGEEHKEWFEKLWD